MRRAAALAALLLSSALAPAAAADRALVIGIDRYPGILVDGVANQRDLLGAVNDARRMAAVMTEAFGVAPRDVLLLTDEKATREGILDAVRDHLVDGTGPGDRVFLYFAGHGVQLTESGGGDETDDGLDEALVPHDARVDLARPGGGFMGALLDDELRIMLAGLAGRQVTVIVDACHSGTITRSALASRASGQAAGYSPVRTLSPFGPLSAAGAKAEAPPVGVAARLAHRRATRLDLLPTRSVGGPAELAVWTAVSSAQYALEDMSVGGSAGLFTGLFARGLGDGEADLNGNGAVTAAELLSFLRDGTRRYCQSYDCLGQDPLPMLEAPDGYDGRVLRQLGEVPVATGPTVDDTAPRLDLMASLSADAMPATTRATVSLAGGGAVRVGEALRLEIRSDVAGRLVVLDQRADGETVQLFPNDFELGGVDASLVAAGEVRLLPGDGAAYELVADAPGRGTIIALVVDPALPIDDLLAAHGGLAPIAEPSAYAASVASAVNRAIVFPDGEGDAEAALEERAAGANLAVRAEAGYEILE